MRGAAFSHTRRVSSSTEGSSASFASCTTCGGVSMSTTSMTSIARLDWRPSLMHVKTRISPVCEALQSLPVSSANTRSPPDGRYDALVKDPLDSRGTLLYVRLAPEAECVKRDGTDST